MYIKIVKYKNLIKIQMWNILEIFLELSNIVKTDLN